MPEPLIDELRSSPVMMRYPGNPVLSKKDVPYKANLISNASES